MLGGELWARLAAGRTPTLRYPPMMWDPPGLSPAVPPHRAAPRGAGSRPRPTHSHGRSSLAPSTHGPIRAGLWQPRCSAHSPRVYPPGDENPRGANCSVGGITGDLKTPL